MAATVALSLCFCFMVYGVHGDDNITVYPSVYWSPRNTLFTGSTPVEIFVLPDSEMTIVCPNVALVEEKTASQTLDQKLFQTLVQVTSQDIFEACDVSGVNGSVSLLNCDKPTQLVSHRLNFSTHARGKSFYFISTSDGVKEATEKSNSHCLKHNLRMKVTVCNQQTDSRCERTKIAPPESEERTEQTSVSVSCNGFWMGFSCGIMMLLLYSMIVNVLLIKHLTCERRKIKPV